MFEYCLRVPAEMNKHGGLGGPLCAELYGDGVQSISPSCQAVTCSVPECCLWSTCWDEQARRLWRHTLWELYGDGVQSMTCAVLECCHVGSGGSLRAELHDDEVQSPSLFGRHVDFGGPPCAEPHGDKSSVKELSNCRVDSGSFTLYGDHMAIKFSQGLGPSAMSTLVLSRRLWRFTLCEVRW